MSKNSKMMFELSLFLRYTFFILINQMSDGQKVHFKNLTPSWKPKAEYHTGELISWGVDEIEGEPQLYKVTANHISQDNIQPNVMMTTPYEPLGYYQGIKQWEFDGVYQTGDKVSDNKTVYVSLMDDNVWAPSQFGWEVVT